jgi:hypothetical protein
MMHAGPLGFVFAVSFWIVRAVIWLVRLCG